MTTSEDFATESPQDVWDANNEGFHYDVPDKSPELWSSEDYTKLCDQTIGRRTQWYCQYCSGPPMGSLEKARRHVENNHMEQLLKKHAPMEMD